MQLQYPPGAPPRFWPFTAESELDKLSLMRITATDAKQALGQAIDQALLGGEVIITRHGRPVVRLTPIRDKRCSLCDGELELARDLSWTHVDAIGCPGAVESVSA